MSALIRFGCPMCCMHMSISQIFTAWSRLKVWLEASLRNPLSTMVCIQSLFCSQWKVFVAQACPVSISPLEKAGKSCCGWDQDLPTTWGIKAPAPMPEMPEEAFCCACWACQQCRCLSTLASRSSTWAAVRRLSQSSKICTAFPPGLSAHEWSKNNRESNMLHVLHFQSAIQAAGC